MTDAVTGIETETDAESASVEAIELSDNLRTDSLRGPDMFRGTTPYSSISTEPTNPNNGYSIYTQHEKYVIVFLAAMAAFWSPISSPIYLPVLPILQKKFKVSEEKLNISVVVFSIFQGFSPVVFSNLADKFGRRIIIMNSLLIYLAANVGLALNNSYIGLILLRCLQAFGISLTVSVASGVAGDLAIKSQRASFIGLASGISLMGQAFGAFIGGIIENSLGWRAIFWFLAISSGVTLVVVYFLLPETSRTLVGNGATLPQTSKLVLVAPVLLLPRYSRRRNLDSELNLTIEAKKPFKFLSPFKIILNQPVYLTLIPSSISYSIWLMMLTTMSTTLSKSYNYSTLDIGLAYIPSGIGGLLGSITIGKVLDLYYKREYKKFRHSKETSVDDHTFNIYKARLNLAIFPTFTTITGTLLFSWSLNLHAHPLVALVGSFLVSFSAMNFITISTTFLADLHPTQFSCSSGCVILTRCWTAAALIAALSKMVSTMGIGGCFSLMSGLMLLTYMTIPYILYNSENYGKQQ